MKSIAASLVLAAAAGSVLADVNPVDFFPPCAVTCFGEATKASSCAATDYVCQCQKDEQTKIADAATPCVLNACGLDVALSKPESPTPPCRLRHCVRLRWRTTTPDADVLSPKQTRSSQPAKPSAVLCSPRPRRHPRRHPRRPLRLIPRHPLRPQRTPRHPLRHRRRHPLSSSTTPRRRHPRTLVLAVVARSSPLRRPRLFPPRRPTRPRATTPAAGPPQSPRTAARPLALRAALRAWLCSSWQVSLPCNGPL